MAEAALKRCSKHEPVPHGDTIQRLGGAVICKNCGMEGSYSNGSRKFGRPRRVIWYRRAFRAQQQG